MLHSELVASKTTVVKMKSDAQSLMEIYLLWMIILYTIYVLCNVLMQKKVCLDRGIKSNISILFGEKIRLGLKSVPCIW